MRWRTVAWWAFLWGLSQAIIWGVALHVAFAKWDGQPGPYSEFFHNLKNQHGQLCCGDSDCHLETDFQWRPRADPQFPYEINFPEAGDEWVKVRADNVVDMAKYPLPAGTLAPDMAVACWTRLFEKPDWGKPFIDSRPWHVYCLVAPSYG